MFTENRIRKIQMTLKQLEGYSVGKEKQVIVHGIALTDKILETKDSDALCVYAEELYLIMDNDKDGLSQIQEMEENERKRIILDCAIDSIAVICRYAYEKAGQLYFPEPIEFVSEETICHLEKSLLKLGL